MHIIANMIQTIDKLYQTYVYSRMTASGKPMHSTLFVQLLTYVIMKRLGSRKVLDLNS